MNKTELISEVAKKCGTSKKDAEKAVNATVDAITEALCKGDKVQLVGFGGFETKSRVARMGRNPKTKETIAERSRPFPAGQCEIPHVPVGVGLDPPAVPLSNPRNGQDRSLRANANFRTSLVGRGLAPAA
jgi:DNA-binding protein HU-beta